MTSKILLLLLLPFFASAQKEENSGVSPAILRHRYAKFLFVRSADAKASLFNVHIKYAYSPRNQNFYSGGLIANVGINLSRFVSNKMILGINYELKQFHGSQPQNLSSTFISDFNLNYIETQSNLLDSTRAKVLKDGLNRTNGGKIEGSTFENVGLSFSPFPQCYGGVILQLSIGNRVFPITGPSTKKLSNPDNQGYGYLTLRNCYSAEVTFSPFKIGNKDRTFKYPDKYYRLYNLLTLSFFYERLNMENASFDKANLSTFVDENFFKSKRRFDNWGLRIGLSLY